MVEDDIPRHSVEESYLTYSALPDLSDSFWPYRSTAIYSFEGLELSYARDVTRWKLHKHNCRQAPGTHHLQLQRDQQFDCGDGNARLGLPSPCGASQPTLTKGCPCKVHGKSQRSNRGKAGFGCFHRNEDPSKVEGEGSAASQHERQVSSNSNASSVLKQKILRRKLLRSKWRIACRFPGLQA
ncbi:Neuroblastoma breakpoint family member 6 [Camelus dromedarius]|uniref:Neuroblastoma breakpoint family member 6 n=1 Tax=Camelus dromedarius TaxID=9838 RepID=A0A5N4DSK4_CAMDR|nr:Neuroblastoma breakpoint family member 6 [Camelus dromedarius]